jgi:hypothetical protein
LIEGIEGYDVTPLRNKDGFWFFVSPRRWNSSSWDMLDLYHADSLTGSWTPHAARPVLIDARFSRPAGAFIERSGRILRPSQECLRGYGDAVTFCRIDALGTSEFAQTPIGRIEAGPFGCHTYNRYAGLGSSTSSVRPEEYARSEFPTSRFRPKREAPARLDTPPLPRISKSDWRPNPRAFPVLTESEPGLYDLM